MHIFLFQLSQLLSKHLASHQISFLKYLRYIFQGRHIAASLMSSGRFQIQLYEHPQLGHHLTDCGDIHSIEISFTCIPQIGTNLPILNDTKRGPNAEHRGPRGAGPDL